MDNNTVKILLDIQSDVSATKALVEQMSGPTGRIAALESDQNKNFWTTVLVFPVLGLAHAVARKFGVNI